MRLLTSCIHGTMLLTLRSTMIRENPLQLLIDTNTDSPAEMRAVARLLIEAAEAATAPEESDREEASRTTISRVGALERTEKVAILKDDAPPPPPPPPSLESAFANKASVPLPPPPPPASDKVEPILDAHRIMTLPTSGGAAALVDSAGVRWDSKLHTSTKTKDIDGKWKARKPREAPVPLHPATVPAGTSAPPPPPPPVRMDAAQAAEVRAAALAPPPPPPPPTVLVPSAESDPDGDDINVESDDTGGSGLVSQGEAPVLIDFASFIARLTSGMNDGSVTQIRVAEVQKQLDIVSLFSLGDTEAAKLQDAVQAFGFVS